MSEEKKRRNDTELSGSVNGNIENISRPTKQQKSVQPTETVETDTDSLLRKNKALGVDLYEKNRRILELHLKCQNLLQSNNQLDSHNKYLSRQWIQLVNDINLAIKRMGCQGEQNNNLEELLECLKKLDAVGFYEEFDLPEWFALDSDLLSGHSVIPPEDVCPITPLEEKTLAAIQLEKDKVDRLNEFLLSLIVSKPNEEANCNESNKASLDEIYRINKKQIQELILTKQKLEKTQQKVRELEKDLHIKENIRHQACRELDRLRLSQEGGLSTVGVGQSVLDNRVSRDSSLKLLENPNSPTQSQSTSILENPLPCQFCESKENEFAQKVKSLEKELDRAKKEANRSKQMVYAYRNKYKDFKVEIKGRLADSMKSYTVRYENTIQAYNDLKKKHDAKGIDKLESHRYKEENQSLRQHLKHYKTLLAKTTKKNEVSQTNCNQEEQSEKEAQNTEDDKIKVESNDKQQPNIQSNTTSFTDQSAEPKSLDPATPKIEESSGENECLIAEIEAISKELDNFQSQNLQLLSIIEQKDKELHEKSINLKKANKEFINLRDELSSTVLLVEDHKKMHDDLQRYQTECQNKDILYEERITKLEKELQKCKESVLAKCNDLSSLKSQHDVTLLKLKDQREKERELILKLEEQKNKGIADLPKGVSTLSELAELELKDLRKLVKCSVCQDRQKDTMIAKCCHIFCKECVDNNIKSRNRKCPTCKKGFGQDDIKAIWLT